MAPDTVLSSSTRVRTRDSAKFEYPEVNWELATMELESFVNAGEKLDNLWDEICRLLDSQDRVAQAKALLRGRAIVKEFERLKAEALATLAALLNQSDLMPDDERAASLIRGFEFGASLADTLHDEFRDIADGETEVVHLMDAVVKALDE